MAEQINKTHIGNIKGKDGFSPYIGPNGNWFDANGDTGISANQMTSDVPMANGTTVELAFDTNYIVWMPYSGRAPYIYVNEISSGRGVFTRFLTDSGGVGGELLNPNRFVKVFVQKPVISTSPDGIHVNISIDGNLYGYYVEGATEVGEWIFKISGAPKVTREIPSSVIYGRYAYHAEVAETAKEVENAQSATKATMLDTTQTYSKDYIGPSPLSPLQHGWGLYQIEVNMLKYFNGNHPRVVFDVIIPDNWDGSTMTTGIKMLKENTGGWARCFLVLSNYNVEYMVEYIELGDGKSERQLGDVLEVASIHYTSFC